MNALTLFRFAVVLVLLAALPAAAQRYAYYPSTTGASQLRVFDTTVETVTATIEIPNGTSRGIAVHPNGTRVYVPGADPFGFLANLSVIDATSNTVLTNVFVGTIGLAPRGIAISPDGGEVWLSHYIGDSLSIFDTTTNTFVGTVTGINSPSAIAFNPAGTIAYVTNFDDGGVVAIDTATRSIITQYVVPPGSEGIAVGPGGRYVYVSFTVGSTTAAIIDTSDGTVSFSPTLAENQWGVAVHPNGRYWYVVYGSEYLAVLRTSDNTLVTTIEHLGDSTYSPAGIAINTAGTYAYVANHDATFQSVSVVNLVTHRMLGSPLVSGGPYALGSALPRPLYGQGTIASGQYHSCRVRPDQTVDCWGRNDYGQTTVPPGTFTQVVAGSAHTCGLKTDRNVTCWGNNSYGQSTPAAGAFVSISSSSRHVCGVRDDGSVACWGDDARGQSTVPASLDNAVSVSAGASHTCALRSSAILPNVICWGNDDLGQSSPPLSNDYIDVAAGASFSCGLNANRTIDCWGDPTDGKTSPPPGLYDAIAISSALACGLRTDGTLQCWGADSHGESVAPATTMALAGPGRFHACALTLDATAQCWGWNFYNQAPQFELNPLAVDNAVLGVASAPQQISMVVANAGSVTPYLPRPAAFAVVAGALPDGLSLSSAGVLSGTPTTLGTFGFTVQGQDANGFTAQRAYSIVVSSGDATAPVITPVVTGTAGGDGWYRGKKVTVAWTIVENESSVTSTVGCATTTYTAETAGQLLTCTATSVGGSGEGTFTLKLDRTAPAMAPVVSNRRPLLNETITVTPGATMGAGSAILSQSCDPAPTNVVSPTQARINCTATDVAGNVAVKPTTYLVIYGFSGFTETVFNPGWLNSAPVGQKITFKYRLTDASGAAVTNATSVGVVLAPLANCTMTVKNATPVSASPLGLVHTGDGNYEFTWTTPASPGCSTVTLQLGDGDHTKKANFRFL